MYFNMLIVFTLLETHLVLPPLQPSGIRAACVCFQAHIIPVWPRVAENKAAVIYKMGK